MIQTSAGKWFVLLAALTLFPLMVKSTEGAAPESFRGMGMPYDAFDALTAKPVTIGGATLNIAFAPGALDLPQARILEWLKVSARAVTTTTAIFLWFRRGC